MTPPRFNAGAALDAAAIRAAAERSPRLRSFVRLVGEHAEAGDRRAGALLEFLIRRVVTDVGELHLSNALVRLERIEVLRDNIASILDHVLEGGELPPGTRPEQLGELFDHLHDEMRELSRPRDAIIGDEPLRIYDDSATYADSILHEFEGRSGEAGAHVEPTAAVAEAYRGLPGPQQSALRRATALRPRELWRAISVETGKGKSGAALAELEQVLGGRLPESELAELRRAIQLLAEARTTALQMTPARLAEPLANIRIPELRALVEAGGDVWILQQLVAHNPRELEAQWQNWLDGGGSATDHAGFRARVRHNMVHWGRAGTAEYTAAFSLSSIEMFLKGPDAHPEAGGIDLIGIGKDGWGWLIDDKSHGEPSVDDVSALTDNLAKNLLDDARTFEDRIQELRELEPGFEADPRAVDIIQRMREAALEIDRIERTTGHLADEAAEAALPADKRLRIAAVLDSYRLRMRVTSAMGEVVNVTQELREIGIDVEPTGINVPWPRRRRARPRRARPRRD